ncbi:MAG: pro-sigmaK processing inhibitor BofA family protein [bacterium]
MIRKILKDILISAIVLIAINLLGQFINFHIPFNLLTILLLGIFKLPGFIIILIILII